jgi:uncharacterized protein YceH (UPF0502 family)
MAQPPLNAVETRVLGCLLEKSATTPDQYPLTLNALVNACNQKSSRNPVTALSPGEVERSLRLLEDRLIVSFESAEGRGRNRTERYSQRFCNTPFGMHQFEPEEYALITVLMLRGPQTPGELRSRTDRMHRFETNDAVTATLEGLMQRETGAVVARLSRAAGRRDEAYMQLFSGTPTDADTSVETKVVRVVQPVQATANSATNLTQRIDELERRVAELERTRGC